MSQIIQTEQITPGAPSASQQTIYPKTTGQYVMDSTGTERKIMVSTDYQTYIAAIVAMQNYGN